MSVEIELNGDYYTFECRNCGRMRVEEDGFCEKCGFDNNYLILENQETYEL